MTGRVVRVAMVCQVMAHYREKVHLELDARKDLDVTFVSDPDGGHYALATMQAALLDKHVQVRNLYFGRFSWQRGVVRRVLRGEYDAFVFTGDASVLSTWVGSIVARLRRKRVLFWTIGWHRPDHGLKKIFRRTFYRLAHRLLLYGNLGLAHGRRAGYPAERMTVIYNSVSESPVRSTTPLRGARPPGSLRLGAIARLQERKRFDLLIRAAANVQARGLDVEVVLAGEGPAASGLRDLASELGVSLELLGAVYGPGPTADFYARTDLTVIPTYAGLSIIQSLAHGVPVVTDDDVDNQGPEWEAITEATGALYDQGDTESLAEAILTVARRQRDGRQRTADACLREISERWTPTGQAVRIAAAIHAEVATEPSRP